MTHTNANIKALHTRFLWQAPKGTGTVKFRVLIKQGEQNKGNFFWPVQELILTEGAAASSTPLSRTVAGAAGEACADTCFKNYFTSTAITKETLAPALAQAQAAKRVRASAAAAACTAAISDAVGQEEDEQEERPRERNVRLDQWMLQQLHPRMQQQVRQQQREQYLHEQQLMRDWLAQRERMHRLHRLHKNPIRLKIEHQHQQIKHKYRTLGLQLGELEQLIQLQHQRGALAMQMLAGAAAQMPAAQAQSVSSWSTDLVEATQRMQGLRAAQQQAQQDVNEPEQLMQECDLATRSLLISRPLPSVVGADSGSTPLG